MNKTPENGVEQKNKQCYKAGRDDNHQGAVLQLRPRWPGHPVKKLLPRFTYILEYFIHQFICARVERLELPTNGFGDRYSTN